MKDLRERVDAMHAEMVGIAVEHCIKQIASSESLYRLYLEGITREVEARKAAGGTVFDENGDLTGSEEEYPVETLAAVVIRDIEFNLDVFRSDVLEGIRKSQ